MPISGTAQSHRPAFNMLVLKVIGVYLAFAAFGWMLGWHWILLAVLAKRREDRIATVAYFCTTVLALCVFAVGGWWCRSSGQYTSCPAGEDMSRGCLLHHQPLDYRFVYTLHYIGLTWLGCAAVMDLLHLFDWTRSAHAGKSMRVFGSTRAIASPWYLCTLVAATAACLTLWLGIVDWSTSSFNAGLLLLGLIALVLLVFSLAALAAHLPTLRAMCANAPATAKVEEAASVIAPPEHTAYP